MYFLCMRNLLLFFNTVLSKKIPLNGDFTEIKQNKVSQYIYFGQKCPFNSLYISQEI
ncbi:hypothetical protein ACI8B_240123 [Acinetobacter proteolyticus]|uniref:Uncharacterized protein n=1 Tax=Acinetobacter proteolyticus TaxID=1776741 RepID=A0A653K5W6_9GAMM|nr:hypothetical protein ACI8B_240123 [Acinetobacter proteolyticus]